MFERDFITGCLYGDVELEDIENYVEYWHTHETNNSLCDFLGMTKYEYTEWLKYGDTVLRDILRCRVDKIAFEQYQYMSSQERIAARSYSIEEIEKLKNEDKHGSK